MKEKYGISVDNFYSIHTNRYSKPILALRKHLYSKGILSIVTFIILSIFDLIHTVGEMFKTPLELVFLLIITIVFDFLTGIKAAKDNKQYILSIGFRQTWVKVLEYSAGLLILTGIANVFGSPDIGKGWVNSILRHTKNLHWLGYLFAIFTEFKSILENVRGKRGNLSGLVNMVEDKLFDDSSSSN